MKKNEKIKKNKENEANKIIVVIKLFIVTKKIKANIGDNPVVTKVYLLKFSKTFNSPTLFSSNRAKHILPNGLNARDIRNKHNKYNG